MRSTPTALSLCLLLVACAPTSQAPRAPNAVSSARPSAASERTNSRGDAGASGRSEGGTKAIPAEFAADVRRSETIGRKIFQHDRWAWVATDAAMARGLLKKNNVKGWVIEEAGEGAIVHFFSGDAPAASLVRVSFPGESHLRPSVAEGAEPLGADLLSAIQARRAASEAKFPVMSDRYNTVVLPASLVEKDGWLVYLLAASAKPNHVVLGGHSRVLVSRDGAVKEVVPLSKGILVLDPTAGLPPGAQPAEIFTSHLVTPYPVETHVFTAMTYGMGIRVNTSAGLWIVRPSGRIGYHGSQ
jgi:hypothetical protein